MCTVSTAFPIFFSQMGNPDRVVRWLWPRCRHKEAELPDTRPVSHRAHDHLETTSESSGIREELTATMWTVVTNSSSTG